MAEATVDVIKDGDTFKAVYNKIHDRDIAYILAALYDYYRPQTYNDDQNDSMWAEVENLVVHVVHNSLTGQVFANEGLNSTRQMVDKEVQTEKVSSSKPKKHKTAANLDSTGRQSHHPPPPPLPSSSRIPPPPPALATRGVPPPPPPVTKGIPPPPPPSPHPGNVSPTAGISQPTPSDVFPKSGVSNYPPPPPPPSPPPPVDIPYSIETTSPPSDDAASPLESTLHAPSQTEEVPAQVVPSDPTIVASSGKVSPQPTEVPFSSPPTDNSPAPPPPPAPPAPPAPPPPPPPPPGGIPPPPGGIPPPPGGIPPPPGGIPPPPGSIPPPPGGIPPPPGSIPPPPSGIPPPPGGIPPPPGGVPFPLQNTGIQNQPGTKVDVINTPNPNCKMKVFNWNKIPARNIPETSIWGEVSKMKDLVTVVYSDLEDLFVQKTSTSQEDEKSKVPSTEISLFDSQRSMNINIFLKKQFPDTDKAIECINTCNSQDLDTQNLKGLLEILPTAEEVEMLRQFDGDVIRLGSAEKFMHQLIHVNFYQIRVKGMLLQSDFSSQIGSIRPNIQLLGSTCDSLLHNTSLKAFLRYVLHVGNFINKFQGSRVSDAVAFSVSSLNKLAMTRSNVQGMTLLHFIIETSQKSPGALQFVDDLYENLQKSSKLTLDNIKAEFKQTKSNVEKLQTELDCAMEVKEKFKDFLEKAESDVEEVEKELENLANQADSLLAYFCEKDLDNFLQCFRQFCEKVKQTEQEMRSSRDQAEQAEKRKNANKKLVERRRSASVVNH